MHTFSEFILLNEAPVNKHMTHLEDAILDLGSDGMTVVLRLLKAMGQKFVGNNTRDVDVTIKFDGAPAVWAGINPENGKFFVATKSMFNKDPKINYTDADIEKNHGHASGLVLKLKSALKYLKPLGIKNVLQGDILFTKGDLTSKNINGKSYTTFTPNTITYAVPSKSDIDKVIQAANIGVVFHTTYSGPSIDSLSASFGASVSNLKHTKAAWIIDPNIPTTKESVLWTAKETHAFDKKITTIEGFISTLDKKFISEVSKASAIKMLIQTHTNARIRKGERIKNPKAHMKDFYKWLDARVQREIDKVKTQATKDRKLANHVELLKKIKKMEKAFIILYTMQSVMIDAKNMILDQLAKLDGLATFNKVADGYEVTAPEGFVAIDVLTGGALKLVDRLTFSKNNFNAAKSFGIRK